MKKNYSSSDISQNPSNNTDRNIIPLNIPNLNYNYKNNLTDTNIKNVLNLETNPNINLNNLNNASLSLLQKQNTNLKSQIKVLTNRIKEYENDYIKDNDRKTNQLKEFSQLESNFNNEIKIKNKKINSLQDENNYLKNYINQMDKDINILKDEVKNLLFKKEKEIENEKNININNQQNNLQQNNGVDNNLINLVKKYSNEITYLKAQNANLINHLNSLNNINKNVLINEEIKKIKMKQEEEKAQFDNFFNNFVKEINEEFFVISQWVETYLGNEYDKEYEIPSLLNDMDKNNSDKLNLINFDLIKSSLEKSASRLNSIINNKEIEIIKLTNIIKEKDNKYNDLQKEIIKMKEKQIELNNVNDKLLFQQEQEKKNSLINRNIIDNLKKSDINSKNNNINYLKYLYQIINNEINAILSDNNFLPYHDKFTNIKENDKLINSSQSNNINYFEEKLNNSLIKLIEFIEELKYDYMQTKNDKINIMKEKVKNIKNESFNQNNNNDLIEEYKFKIEELINNNKMLKEQINIINKNNEIKFFKDDEMMVKLENFEKENQNLRFNNDNLLNKLEMANENYLALENENNKLKQRIQQLKMLENDDENIKQKINELSNDYQRILKENNSLKLFLNSQNLSN